MAVEDSEGKGVGGGVVAAGDSEEDAGGVDVDLEIGEGRPENVGKAGYGVVRGYCCRCYGVTEAEKTGGEDALRRWMIAVVFGHEVLVRLGLAVSSSNSRV